MPAHKPDLGNQRENDLSKNRDDEMRPAGEGRPPRPAYHPPGTEASTRTAKTLTDPATGEPRRGAPPPASSSSDETPAQQD